MQMQMHRQGTAVLHVYTYMYHIVVQCLGHKVVAVCFEHNKVAELIDNYDETTEPCISCSPSC